MKRGINAVWGSYRGNTGKVCVSSGVACWGDVLDEIVPPQICILQSQPPEPQNVT